MHQTFLYIALLFMHDYDVKLSNCTFYGGGKQAKEKFSFSFPSFSGGFDKVNVGCFAYTEVDSLP